VAVVDVVATRGRVSPPVVLIGAPLPVSVAVVPLVVVWTVAVESTDRSVRPPHETTRSPATAATMVLLMIIVTSFCKLEQSSRPVGLTCERLRPEAVYG
jgi:hypothetical protein